MLSLHLHHGSFAALLSTEDQLLMHSQYFLAYNTLPRFGWIRGTDLTVVWWEWSADGRYFGWAWRRLLPPLLLFLKSKRTKSEIFFLDYSKREDTKICPSNWSDKPCYICLRDSLYFRIWPVMNNLRTKVLITKRLMYVFFHCVKGPQLCLPCHLLFPNEWTKPICHNILAFISAYE